MMKFLFRLWLIFICNMDGIRCVKICSTGHWSINGTTIAGSRSGVAGSTLTRLRQPMGVLLTNNDTLYVLDSLNYRLLRYALNSTTGISVISSTMTNRSNQFSSMDGMSMDNNGHLYLLDGNLSRIIEWIPGVNNGTIVVDGQFIVNSSLGLRDSLNKPRGMFIEYDPLIFWIADTNNHRVIEWKNSSSVQILGGTYGSQSDQLKYPQGIFIQRDHHQLIIYIADSENHRVQMWLTNSHRGQTIAGRTGYYGSRPDQLWNPTALIVDENQTMFIVDSFNSRILKWFIGHSAGLVIAGSEQSGTLPNQLNSPIGFAFNSYGALVVADTDNHRIQFFNISCEISTSLTTTMTPITFNMSEWIDSWSKNGTTIAGSTFGEEGSNSVLLSYPADVSIDENNRIYVLDSNNYRVQLFDPNASMGITVLNATQGSSLQQVAFMDAFHVSKDESIYILDDENARVTKWLRGSTSGILVAGGNGQGKSLNQLKYPLGFVVEEETSIIWIADTDNCRVVKWISLTNISLVAGNQTCGSQANQLNYPLGLFLDQSDGHRIYVADTDNNRIQLWLEGEQQGRTLAGQSQQLNEPTTLIVENNLRMFIVDSGNHRIVSWKIGSNYGQVLIGGDYYGTLPNQLHYPLQIKFDSNRALIVVDYENHRIQKFHFNHPSTISFLSSMTTTMMTRAVPSNVAVRSSRLQQPIFHLTFLFSSIIFHTN